jgi:hypothetical protein
MIKKITIPIGQSQARLGVGVFILFEESLIMKLETCNLKLTTRYRMIKLFYVTSYEL